MRDQHTVDPVALVTAARKGDAAAQDALASAYLPLLYNIVGRALNGSADVDDVVQDTMLRALDGLGGLRTPESFRSWLVAIAMNRVRAHWQSRSAAPGTLEEAAEVADPGADFVDLTMVRLQLSGQRQETARATRWLEPDDRSLLSLWWLECAGELTRTEVAEALELSPQTAAVRVQRMKAQLETARVVVRALDAQPSCQELRAVLTTWDGRPSALWRKRIARHARDCLRCAGMWSGLMPAEGLLAGLALVPLSAGLLALWPARDAGMAPVAATRPLDPAAADGAIPAPPGRHRSSGGHRARGRSTSRADARRRRRTRRRVVGAAVLAACMTGGGLWYASLGPGSGSDGDSSTASASAGPMTDLSASEDSAATSPAPTPSHSASPSPSPSAKKSTAATPSRKPKKSVAPTPRKTAPAPRPSASAAPPAPTTTTAQVVALVNKERAAAGCGPVAEDTQLTDAAQRHSDDMAARDFFEHTNPDGADPGRRITDAGYRWSTYGENIARGQQTPESVMESWMNSPGHRANILNCSFKDIGIGIHNGSGGPWWTQDFGAKL
ncbi:sigma-70 family RNA polymerase sigma factor [Streptomyces sp. ITFR-16]|uniref:sigma-70 family RNA polymerase sigma factor n=1 Tax=Streptomyces sp. ITFR-16 TaxID=3075198 RepID=UPI00288B6B8A|nr:sigma-70 family RNA polymerase sigma factor [Streptomyces sp. ITFR-16]WNI20485.1 sigma-70 family RNA polymerase sigma factor [Streptomyces sp. ITFR-16]